MRGDVSAISYPVGQRNSCAGRNKPTEPGANSHIAMTSSTLIPLEDLLVKRRFVEKKKDTGLCRACAAIHFIHSSALSACLDESGEIKTQYRAAVVIHFVFGKT